MDDEFRVRPHRNGPNFRWMVVDAEGYPQLGRQLFSEYAARQIAELLNRDIRQELNHGMKVLDDLRQNDHS